MKSAHRHQLETNALAQRLNVAIERFRPYATTVAGTIIALIVIMFVWSYVSRSLAENRGEAWNAYHQAVAAQPPNLSQLHQSAQEYPRTKMQQMADITWAEGQVWMAARDYVYNRAASKEALDRATSAFQGVLQSADDERLINRAHLGLARIYEMRNELDKARDEYRKVGGGFADYAKRQIERLADPKVKETYDWLATAQPPRLSAPTGPGTPGKPPEFSAGDIPLPGTEPDGESPEGTPAAGDPFENLLRDFDFGQPTSDAVTPDGTSEPAPPATEGETPATNIESPADETPPASDADTGAPRAQDQPVE